MDNQQGPTVEHMELCPVSCGGLDDWELGLGENGNMYMYGWIPLLKLSQQLLIG